MFLLYYKNNCPYSKNAYELMKSLNLDHESILVDDNMQSIRDELKTAYNHLTLPAIFYSQKIDRVASRSNIPARSNSNIVLTGESRKKNKNNLLTVFIGGYDKMSGIVGISKSLDVNSNYKQIYEDRVKKNYNISYRDFLKIANEICKN